MRSSETFPPGPAEVGTLGSKTALLIRCLIIFTYHRSSSSGSSLPLESVRQLIALWSLVHTLPLPPPPPPLMKQMHIVSKKPKRSILVINAVVIFNCSNYCILTLHICNISYKAALNYTLLSYF